MERCTLSISILELSTDGLKVLLTKVGDKVHATSANCTHYGAPLKNGVLTPEGRLTCPWHGGSYKSHPYDGLHALIVPSLLQRCDR